LTDALITHSDTSIPIHAIAAGELEDWLAGQPEPLARFARAAGFAAEEGEILLVPADDGPLDRVLLGLGDAPDPWTFARGAESLPPGDYDVANGAESADADRIALAWLLGTYRFTRYKTSDRESPRLVAPAGADIAEARRIAEAVFLARDLVNTPADDMGPDALQAAAESLGERYGATVETLVGDALLDKNFPMIHAVGRAAAIPPRLIDLTWGDPDAPKLTLVGKGVCFDSGGLNIKSASSARLMKKDMGGAANALALARLVMDAGLKVRLRVLIPAVENAISGSAYRPGDILASRKGLSVEIDNTDAEGRLVLGDALALAAEESPELMIDFATLTGAARVALGPQLAPFYTDDDDLAAALAAEAEAAGDPVWRMPLHRPYLKMLESPIADMVNSASGGHAGSITAALFLRQFAGEGTWMHFDIFAWNPESRPGRPLGGEAQGPRAVYRVLKRRYG